MLTPSTDFFFFLHLIHVVIKCLYLLSIQLQMTSPKWRSLSSVLVIASPHEWFNGLWATTFMCAFNLKPHIVIVAREVNAANGYPQLLPVCHVSLLHQIGPPTFTVNLFPQRYAHFAHESCPQRLPRDTRLSCCTSSCAQPYSQPVFPRRFPPFASPVDIEVSPSVICTLHWSSFFYSFCARGIWLNHSALKLCSWNRLMCTVTVWTRILHLAVPLNCSAQPLHAALERISYPQCSSQSRAAPQ